MWRLVGIVAVMALAAAAATSSPARAAAPDGRSYELVSPPDKGGAIPQFPTSGPASFAKFNALTQASADGNQLLWFALLPLPGATNGQMMSYESQRTPGGWVSRQASPDPITKYPSALLSASFIRDATDDLSERVIPSNQPYDPLIQPPFPARSDIFLQDAAHHLTWISRPNSGPATDVEVPVYYGRDATASHVLWGSTQKLVPEASANVKGHILYDHTGGQTVMVNVQSDGVTPTSVCGAILGNATTNPNGRNAQTAVTPDGTAIYFESPDPDGRGNAACNQPTQLYLRRGGVTTEISRSQRDTPDPLGEQDVAFQGASADGNTVYFLSPTALTNGASDGKTSSELLYRYDVRSGLLTLVTPNDTADPVVYGVVGMSADGSRLYVAAGGPLEPGKGTAGMVNLYSYQDGTFTFIATADAAGNTTQLLSIEANRPVQVSADGTRFAFVSSNDAGPYQTDGFDQVFVYDAPTDTLWCASCPTSTASVGDSGLKFDAKSENSRAPLRNLTADGRTLFFTTPNALVPDDSNGLYDVYAWHDGVVRLVTTGRADADAFFASASADGRDVFFSTAARLVPQDVDRDIDFYDARAGGGFAVPAPPSVGCVGDQCQGSASGPPTMPSIGSASFGGRGNVSVAPASSRVSLRVWRSRVVAGRTARLRLGVSGAGRIMTSGREVRDAHKRVMRAGTFRIKIRLTARGRKHLARKKRLRVVVRVVYRPRGGRTVTRRVKLVFRQQAPRHRKTTRGSR